MYHYLLTRSAYGPDYPLDANRRRLELLRRITAPSLAAQTERRWTWLVRLDDRDPLIEERAAAINEACPRARFIYRRGSELEPWESAIRFGAHPILQTRLDDDDALAPDFIARIRAAAATLKGGRLALMLPVGWKVAGDRADPWVRLRNQYVTLRTPPRDTAIVQSVQHPQIEDLAPVHEVDRDPAWLWIRHDDSASANRGATTPLTDDIRAAFPAVDWDFIASLVGARGPERTAPKRRRRRGAGR